MKSKLITLTFVMAALFLTCSNLSLEAKSRTRFGFSFGSNVTRVAPVYTAPRPQPVYVYPACPHCQPVVYQVPVYHQAPVVYNAPVYAPQPTYHTSGFSFSFGNFWR